MTTGDNVPKMGLKGPYFWNFEIFPTHASFYFSKTKNIFASNISHWFCFQKFHNGFMFENWKLVWKLSEYQYQSHSPFSIFKFATNINFIKSCGKIWTIPKWRPLWMNNMKIINIKTTFNFFSLNLV